MTKMLLTDMLKRMVWTIVKIMRKVVTISLITRENTWAHIWDQVDRRRGYDKQFADRIMDLIDAYYSGGSSYVENDVEAESRLLAEALHYVADKLEGEIK